MIAAPDWRGERPSWPLELPGLPPSEWDASPSARRRADSMSSRPTGCVRKYFAPFCRDCNRAWWSWLMVRMGSRG